MKTTKNTYHLKTKANFEFVKYGNQAIENYNELVKEFGEHFHSASGSKYVVDNNGILYRLSNHWGKVSSCEWNLKNAPEHIYAPWNLWRKELVLAKTDLKDVTDMRNEVKYFKFEGVNISNGRKSIYFFEENKTTIEKINEDFEVLGEIEIITHLE